MQTGSSYPIPALLPASSPRVDRHSKQEPRSNKGEGDCIPPELLDDFVDYVDFHIKCDLILRGPSPDSEKGSQKKCRFCS